MDVEVLMDDQFGEQHRLAGFLVPVVGETARDDFLRPADTVEAACLQVRRHSFLRPTLHRVPILALPEISNRLKAERRGIDVIEPDGEEGVRLRRDQTPASAALRDREETSRLHWRADDLPERRQRRSGKGGDELTSRAHAELSKKPIGVEQRSSTETRWTLDEVTIRNYVSSEQLFDNSPVDISQPEVAALVLVSEF